MVKDILQTLNNKEDLRQNLTLLRTEIKERNLIDTDFTAEELKLFIGFLKNEDAKIRKNAALLLGDIRAQEALQILFQSYETEQQLFVRSSYVVAMEQLDCRSVLSELKRQYNCLQNEIFKDNEKKHKDAEKHALAELLLAYEEKKRHEFSGLDKTYHVLLVMEAVFAEQLKKKLPHLMTKVTSYGLMIATDNIEELRSIRTYREILLELPKKVKKDLISIDEISSTILSSNLIDFLYAVHKGNMAFTFRVDIKGKLPLDQKSVIAKKVAQGMEDGSNHKLINSTSNYEFEIRLLQKKDGSFYPFLKLYTIQQQRFDYRKNTISTSLHPSKAAAIIDIVSPYLTEKAQVLDPFSGVGTLLVERARYKETSDIYGIDIYGEAIKGARENAELAHVDINYINRDYFDFTHTYLFDEIITEFPQRGRKTREEWEEFYASFFKKSVELLKKSGVMIIYSNEMNLIKKQLRIQKELQIKREICVQEKDGYYIFIIGFKG